MNSLSSKKTKNKNTNINSVNNKSMKNLHKKIDDSFKNKCVNKLFRTKTNFLDPLQTNTQATKRYRNNPTPANNKSISYNDEKLYNTISNLKNDKTKENKKNKKMQITSENKNKSTVIDSKNEKIIKNHLNKRNVKKLDKNSESINKQKKNKKEEKPNINLKKNSIKIKNEKNKDKNVNQTNKYVEHTPYKSNINSKNEKNLKKNENTDKIKDLEKSLPLLNTAKTPKKTKTLINYNVNNKTNNKNIVINSNKLDYIQEKDEISKSYKKNQLEVKQNKNIKTSPKNDQNISKFKKSRTTFLQKEISFEIMKNIREKDERSIIRQISMQLFGYENQKILNPSNNNNLPKNADQNKKNEIGETFSEIFNNLNIFNSFLLLLSNISYTNHKMEKLNEETSMFDNINQTYTLSFILYQLNRYLFSLTKNYEISKKDLESNYEMFIRQLFVKSKKNIFLEEYLANVENAQYIIEYVFKKINKELYKKPDL